MNARIALFLPNLEGGGAERAFVELANEFAKRGATVDFVLVHRHGDYVAELADAVRVVDLGTSRLVIGLWRLVRYLKQERPDALLSGLDPTNAVAIVASILAGVRDRCVISQRAVIRRVWQIDFPRTWRIWMWLLRQLYSCARLVICNSSAAATEVVHDMGVRPQNCVVLLNPVDMPRIDALARERVEEPWLAASAPPLILSVGTLTPRKDMETLIRAFAVARRSHECNLLILGEGTERERLEKVVRELGLQQHLRMPGFASNPFPWIKAADVLVSASLAEGCPNVIQQALACGTAIVATDCPGGTAEVLENGRWGRLVPMRDPQAMADAILATLDDSSPPDGRVRARDFDVRRIAERYLQLLLPASPPSGDGREYALEARPS